MEFNTGDYILLLTKNLKLKQPKKSLWPKYIKLFKILKLCEKLTYYLDLFLAWQIHDVINISRLEWWWGDSYPYKRLVIILKDIKLETE